MVLSTPDCTWTSAVFAVGTTRRAQRHLDLLRQRRADGRHHRPMTSSFHDTLQTQRPTGLYVVVHKSSRTSVSAFALYCDRLII